MATPILKDTQVQSGATLNAASGGTVDANSIKGQPVSAAGTTSGQLLIYDSGANQWVPGDPLVQGLFADGSASIGNPVMVGGSDYAGTPHQHIAKVDSGGLVHVSVDAGSAAGTQYADNAASGSTPTGNLMSSWDVANSKVRAVVCDSNQFPKFNIAASSLTDPAEVVAGTTASTKVLIIGGKTNDGTPQYKEFPLGASARSVIVEGFAGGTAVPVSLAANQSTNVAQLNGTTTDTNSGTKSAGTLRVVLATDQPQLTNKLLVTPDANSQVDFNKVAGTATDVNSGNKSAGTLRVVLATDQPALTNKLLVTPDSVALPLHQSTNVDQLNGTTTDTNSGSKSAGTLRVVLATDQPALTNKLLVTPDSVALPLHQSVNVDQLNGTTTDTNSGSKSAGTLRVVLATDQPALTNKLLVTPDSVALPLHQSVNVDQINGSTTSTAASGVQKVGITGSAAGVLDAVITAATAPTNGLATLGIFNTTQPAPTNGQSVGIQIDQAANVLVFNGVAMKTLSTQGTSLNSAQTIFSLSGAQAVMVQLTQTTTITAGAVTFEFTYDGTNFIAVPANCVVDPTSTTFAQVALPYTCQASTNKVFLILCNGATGLRIRTSTAITGTGTVTPNYALLNNDPLPSVVALSPTAGNFNVTATLNPETTKVIGTTRTIGNTGAALDATVAAGTAPTNALATLVQYNTTIPAPTAAQTVSMQGASDGALYVNTESRKTTYSCFASFTPAAGDIAVMPGSATKTIRVLRAEVSLSTTGTTAIEAIQLVKRSAADTSGTSASMTAVPHDSNYAGASAAPLSYTVAPTPGAAVGTIRGVQFSDASGTTPGSNTWLWDWGVRPGTSIVLRGTAQQLCVNLGAVVATQTATVSFEWTEE